ncbi:copper amine oxidase N-terminal domain-containing protein [Paenibacillus sp. KQZ6P-2]|uniref:Copper amine oxidase N-terminal domain-containing protein n=1 Tax=Paenibacillus mangrovi TaxID=2931978 RepID=A0A9X2B3M0_9BACL|nr:copper amine oxidase N-terminal domain-containing protein [Paenibacillus mangrovi]MCJ8010128.1 copper amine oxidase N-terminal domain-containing protein [Paenibacillus mangrovi]
MKKILCSLLVISSVLLSVTSATAGSLNEDHIKLKVNGAYLIYSKGEMPFVDKNSRILLPLRVIADLINGKITWDSKAKSVQIEAKDFELTAVLNEKGATINGKKIASDTSLTLKNGTTLVPAKWIADGLGVSLKWDAKNKIISLDDNRFFQAGPLERMNNEWNKESSIDPQIAPQSIGYQTVEGVEQLKITMKNLSTSTYTSQQIQDHLLVYIDPNHFIEEGINGMTNSDRSGLRLIDEIKPNKTYTYTLPVGRLDQKQLKTDVPQYAFVRYFIYK